MTSCCCKCNNIDLKKEKICEGCYPNLTVSPITVKIAKKPRIPPYIQPRIKRLDYDELLPKLTNAQLNQSLALMGANKDIPCVKCATKVREKDVQLLRKEQELAHLRRQFGARHNYTGIRGLEYELLLRDQEIARLRMEEAKRQNRLRKEEMKRPPCEGCAGFLRRKELQLREIQQEVVKQMAGPYVKISPNPCDCCSGAVQPKSNEKARRRNRNNCFKELQKRERALKKKEKDIDDKIKKFRQKVLAEAKADLDKIPDPRNLKREVHLKCKCACDKRTTLKKNYDPCSYLPNALGGSLSCSMPHWNTIAPRQHDCTTKCCVLKVVENLAHCAFRPMGGWKKHKKKNIETCVVMRGLRWWLRKNT